MPLSQASRTIHVSTSFLPVPSWDLRRLAILLDFAAPPDGMTLPSCSSAFMTEAIWWEQIPQHREHLSMLKVWDDLSQSYILASLSCCLDYASCLQQWSVAPASGTG